MYLSYALLICTSYFIIKNTQLPPTKNCRKGLTTQVICLRFCDLIMEGGLWVLNENTHPQRSLQFKFRRVLRVIQSKRFQVVCFKSETVKVGRMQDKALWEVVRNLSPGFCFRAKSLFRDPSFHLHSCENQITSIALLVP